MIIIEMAMNTAISVSMLHVSSFKGVSGVTQRNGRFKDNIQYSTCRFGVHTILKIIVPDGSTFIETTRKFLYTL